MERLTTEECEKFRDDCIKAIITPLPDLLKSDRVKQ